MNPEYNVHDELRKVLNDRYRLACAMADLIAWIDRGQLTDERLEQARAALEQTDEKADHT